MLLYPAVGYYLQEQRHSLTLDSLQLVNITAALESWQQIQVTMYKQLHGPAISLSMSVFNSGK